MWNTLISSTAKLLDEPSPVEPGISENAEISIGKLILKHLKLFEHWINNFTYRIFKLNFTPINLNL